MGAALLVLGGIGVVDVVRWIGKGHVGQITAHQGFQRHGVGGIATQQAMLTQQPHITWLAYGVVGDLRYGVIVGQSLVASQLSHQRGQFVIGKAGQ